MPFVRIDALRAIGIPSDDLFQVLTSHDGTSGMLRYDTGYLGVRRDDDLVFVTLSENTFADWSFGEGVAQYLATARG
jgi:hypothetical protein